MMATSQQNKQYMIAINVNKIFYIAVMYLRESAQISRQIRPFTSPKGDSLGQNLLTSILMMSNDEPFIMKLNCKLVQVLKILGKKNFIFYDRKYKINLPPIESHFRGCDYASTMHRLTQGGENKSAKTLHSPHSLLHWRLV